MTCYEGVTYYLSSAVPRPADARLYHTHGWSETGTRRRAWQGLGGKGEERCGKQDEEIWDKVRWGGIRFEEEEEEE